MNYIHSPERTFEYCLPGITGRWARGRRRGSFCFEAGGLGSLWNRQRRLVDRRHIGAPYEEANGFTGFEKIMRPKGLGETAIQSL